MKVFIYFEGFCERFDFPPDQTVGAVKQMVKEHFLVHLSDDKQARQYLELSYAGAALKDTWALSDVGIRSGSVLRCLIKIDQKPVLHVYDAVTGKMLLIMGSEALLHMSVTRLKTVVSIQTSLPVSIFRLSTSAGVQLYDCNRLLDYDIKVGTTLRLDTWDGWVEFLQGCLLGHRLMVQSHLSENKLEMRFQLKVALYITASLGHLDLAGWLLEKGVHADEPVGVHPYRLWCFQTSHRDTGKCPIHIAAESSQLLILKFFITRNPLALACRDPDGRDPLKVALQQGHSDCVRYLTNKLYSVISLPNISLPMRIYLQIKRWVTLGQKQAACNRWQLISPAFKVKVADKLLIDGFNRPNMSSKSKKTVRKERKGMKTKALQPLSSHLIPRGPPLRQLNLPLVNQSDFDKTQHDLQERKDWQQEKFSEENDCSNRGQFILPPINRRSVTKPLFDGAFIKSSCFLTESQESFPQHCGRTPRENAIYCLTTASAFTEKPWMRQLKIAQTLIKKHVHTTA